MFYAEINENGKCFHITENELPLGDNIIATEENVIGKIWDGEKFIDDPTVPEPEAPTQLDAIEESQLIIMEAIAEQYELNEERYIDDLEIKAEIYEAILEMGGNV